MSEMTRRRFLAYSGAAAAVGVTGLPRLAVAATPTPTTYAPAPLAYAADALAPIISAATIGFHYGKHHAGYGTNLTNLVTQPQFAAYSGLSAERIMLLSANRSRLVSLFNNAAQLVNHDFYWASLKPGGGNATPPTGAFLDAINAAFGSFDNLKAQLQTASVGRFGTGWGWLVLHRGALKVISTEDADNPLMYGMKPLLTIDVWEHAYYVDFQNRRADHVAAVIANLLDWGKAAERFAGA